MTTGAGAIPGPSHFQGQRKGRGMTRIIRNLAEIGGDYGVLFCDLWGCVHNGKIGRAHV